MANEGGNAEFSGTGYSPVKIYTKPFHFHTWEIIINGSPTGVDVRLQGSLTGRGWGDLDVYTGLTSVSRHAVNKLIRQVRVQVVTLSGGTAPTIEAIWESGD